VERDAHALEVIYSHLKLKQINQKMSGGVSNLPGFFLSVFRKIAVQDSNIRNLTGNFFDKNVNDKDK
jgi:hypothetical protein